MLDWSRRLFRSSRILSRTARFFSPADCSHISGSTPSRNSATSSSDSGSSGCVRCPTPATSARVLVPSHSVSNSYSVAPKRLYEFVSRILTTKLFSPATVCSLTRRSVRNFGRCNPFARTLEAFRLVGPKRMANSLWPRGRSGRPRHLHGHSGSEIGDAFAAEFRGYAVAVTGRIDHGADFHHGGVQLTIRVADERKPHFGP